MTVASTTVTVASTATLLATGGSSATARSPGTNVAVKPAVAGTGDLVFLGGADVTTANGMPLGTGLALFLNDDEELYGIVASSTTAVRVVETGI